LISPDPRGAGGARKSGARLYGYWAESSPKSMGLGRSRDTTGTERIGTRQVGTGQIGTGLQDL
jgi:hypothetical protein